MVKIYPGQQILLLDEASATGDWQEWHGGARGRGQLSLAGTLGGATVKLQKLGPDGVTPLDVGLDVTFTAPGLVNLELPRGSYRGQVSGGAPSGLFLLLERF